MASTPRMEAEAAPLRRMVRSGGAADDRTLVGQAQRGSKPAFEELVRRHQHRVFALAGGILKRREDVEDVAQQVFVKAYLSLPGFDQRAAFSTWLYKITVNECWDFLRKKKVRPLVYEADLNEEQARQFSAVENVEASGSDYAEQLDSRRRVESLLESLDQRDQLMLILKEVDGFSVEEIGDLLKLNPNTVKVRLFRARRKMISLHRKRKKS